MWRCAQCETKNDDQARVCVVCNNPRTNESDKEAYERKRQSRHDYAYDCAMEMAVNAYANRALLESDLTHYCKYDTTCERRRNSERNEAAFLEAVRLGKPSNVPEDNYLAAAEMFKAIGDEKADMRAEQCLELAELARQDNSNRKSGMTDAEYDADDYADEYHEHDKNVDKAEKKHCSKEHTGRTGRRVLTVVMALACTVALLFVIRHVVIPKMNYDKAVNARENGEYEEAIAAFEALGDYGDAAEQASEIRYAQAVAARENGQYEDAITAFEALGDYSDAAEQLSETWYQYADAKYAVGNYVEFGTYPQTSSGTDETPIEWLVLARDGDEALLISRYALDAQPYNEEYEDVTWGTCTLRTWLNTDFYNIAFSMDDKQHIIKSNVTADRNPDYSTDPGNDTTDNVFLLSIDEVDKYFAGDTDRICYPTDYAKEQGADTYGSEACWWLRSPGLGGNYAAGVSRAGSVFDFGVSVIISDFSVRPAVWVRLF